MNYNYGVRKKSVVSVILLTFITCGIYTFFWMYQPTKTRDENAAHIQDHPEISASRRASCHNLDKETPLTI